MLTLDDLCKMKDDELRRRHDQAVQGGQTEEANQYLGELNRKAIDKQTTAMQTVTVLIAAYTIVLAFLAVLTAYFTVNPPAR